MADTHGNDKVYEYDHRGDNRGTILSKLYRKINRARSGEAAEQLPQRKRASSDEGGRHVANNRKSRRRRSLQFRLSGTDSGSSHVSWWSFSKWHSSSGISSSELDRQSRGLSTVTGSTTTQQEVLASSVGVAAESTIPDGGHGTPSYHRLNRASSERLASTGSGGGLRVDHGEREPRENFKISGTDCAAHERSKSSKSDSVRISDRETHASVTTHPDATRRRGYRRYLPRLPKISGGFRGGNRSRNGSGRRSRSGSGRWSTRRSSHVPSSNLGTSDPPERMGNQHSWRRRRRRRRGFRSFLRKERARRSRRHNQGVTQGRDLHREQAALGRELFRATMGGEGDASIQRTLSTIGSHNDNDFDSGDETASRGDISMASFYSCREVDPSTRTRLGVNPQIRAHPSMSNISLYNSGVGEDSPIQDASIASSQRSSNLFSPGLNNVSTDLRTGSSNNLPVSRRHIMASPPPRRANGHSPSLKHLVVQSSPLNHVTVPSPTATSGSLCSPMNETSSPIPVPKGEDSRLFYNDLPGVRWRCAGGGEPPIDGTEGKNCWTMLSGHGYRVRSEGYLGGGPEHGRKVDAEEQGGCVGTTRVVELFKAPEKMFHLSSSPHSPVRKMYHRARGSGLTTSATFPNESAASGSEGKCCPYIVVVFISPNPPHTHIAVYLEIDDLAEACISVAERKRLGLYPSVLDGASPVAVSDAEQAVQEGSKRLPAAEDRHRALLWRFITGGLGTRPDGDGSGASQSEEERVLAAGWREFRNNRFKVIPRISEGSWLMRKYVGTTPALLATKLTAHYYQGLVPFQTPNGVVHYRPYLEIDVDIGSSIVATALTDRVMSYAESLVIDLQFLAQGNARGELPERLWGGIRLRHCNLSVVPVIRDHAIVQAHQRSREKAEKITGMCLPTRARDERSDDFAHKEEENHTNDFLYDLVVKPPTQQGNDVVPSSSSSVAATAGSDGYKFEQRLVQER